MNKQIILTIIIPVLVVFIVLGMRNPYLNNNHGPKQRPRAVIENILSAADEVIQQHDLVAVIHCCLVSIQESQTFPSIHHDETPTLRYTPANNLPSRAPPACTTILS